MADILKNDWAEYLNGEFEKEYYQKLRRFLAEEYRTKTVYPDMYDIFNALHYTAYKDVKVVILGQDPYRDRHTGLVSRCSRGLQYRRLC